MLSLALLAAVAADPQAGRRIAGPCGVCHGANGVSRSDLWPNLAGQKQGYLRQSLTAYRDGARKHPMMTPQAKRLTDRDIANLAAFYAGMTR